MCGGLYCVRKCRHLGDGGGAAADADANIRAGGPQPWLRRHVCMHAYEACPNMKPNLPLSFDEDGWTDDERRNERRSRFREIRRRPGGGGGCMIPSDARASPPARAVFWAFKDLAPTMGERAGHACNYPSR